MVSIESTQLAPSFSARFFAPLLDLLPACDHRRVCPSISDEDWLQIGIHRVLMAQTAPSGRGFLQILASIAPDLCPETGLFFETLKSQRRLDLCDEINSRLCASAASLLPDALVTLTSLANFDISAADGHFHTHATHDPADEKGVKYATGHLYIRNLRSGLIKHLTAFDQLSRKKEHDMRALKRLSIDALRQGAPKGRKVLIAYDKAVIDFALWHRWKQGSGIYCISRPKENMTLTVCGELAFDRKNPMNAGVISDELVSNAQGGAVLRRITFINCENGETLEFLTNVIEDGIPGELAFVYRLRWNIEKSFDEFKNKLGEKKAWASSAEAKSMQAQLICLSVNLLSLFEAGIAKETGIVNQPEIKRRAKRLKGVQIQAKKAGVVVPRAVEAVQQMTQHSLKFIRWVATQLWLANPWATACAALAKLYAAL